MWSWFLMGLILGVFLGVLLMCLLQMVSDPFEIDLEEKGQRFDEH